MVNTCKFRFLKWPQIVRQFVWTWIFDLGPDDFVFFFRKNTSSRTSHPTQAPPQFETTKHPSPGLSSMAVCSWGCFFCNSNVVGSITHNKKFHQKSVEENNFQKWRVTKLSLPDDPPYPKLSWFNLQLSLAKSPPRSFSKKPPTWMPR